MTREPGFYWVRMPHWNGNPMVAEWDLSYGTSAKGHWLFCGRDRWSSDEAVQVVSERLEFPPMGKHSSFCAECGVSLGFRADYCKTCLKKHAEPA